MSIRIVLCDDHKIMRDGLRELIAAERDLELVGEATDGYEALRMAQELAPDVIVMDVAMATLNGIAATRRIRSEVPAVRVLALSMHSDKRFVMGMLEAGAFGYLLKDCAFAELANAIRAIKRGETYVSPKVAGAIADGKGGGGPARPAETPLTVKEREVLQLISEGKSTKDVAALLDISVKTVETHRQHIMDKLNIRSVAELTKYAVREGLTSLES
jgi:two-component system, NarL family, response regulator NreC